MPTQQHDEVARQLFLADLGALLAGLPWPDRREPSDDPCGTFPIVGRKRDALDNPKKEDT